MALTPEPPPDNTSAADERVLLFHRYRIERELGRGGMGRVLLAYDTKLAMHVAIKVLPDSVSDDSQATNDLRAEVLRGIALNHDGIVRTHTFEMDESGAAIVMEFVDGWTLGDLKQQRPGGCFDTMEILPWIEQLCGVLDYAHRVARIVHRDLKPRNLMVARDGQLKIADFGIAAQLSDAITRQTGQGPSSGTPAYMSPQQAMGKTPSHLDDIHALGATIYDLLTGKAPFFRGNVIAQVLNAEPPPMAQRRQELGVGGKAAIPPAWESAVAACLAKEPGQRPQSAGELLMRLREADFAPPAGGDAEAETAPVPRSHAPTWIAAAVVVVAGLTWLSFVATNRPHSETQNAPPSFTPAPATPVAEVPHTPPPAAPASPVPVRATAMAATAPSLAITPAPLQKPATPAPATPAPSEMAKLTTPAPRATPQPKLIANKDRPWENSLGMRFAPVPVKGGPSAGKDVLFSVWDTRVKDYEVFALTAKRAWERPKFPQEPAHPAVNVSWEDARAFCAWLTEREHGAGKLPPNYAYRLPTDHEWSCAAGIGEIEEAKAPPRAKNRVLTANFPWTGATPWPPPAWAGNYADETAKRAKSGYGYLPGFNDGFAFTSPVGRFRANAFGLCDLGGNVWQWCEDRIEPGQPSRVLRGASWVDAARENLLSSARLNAEPDSRGEAYGFRCVLSDVPARPD